MTNRSSVADYLDDFHEQGEACAYVHRCGYRTGAIVLPSCQCCIENPVGPRITFRSADASDRTLSLVGEPGRV